MGLLLIGLGVLPQLASAQAASGALSAKVIIASGTGIPNARVTLKNGATDLSRIIATDAAGFCNFPNLEPGTYEMTIKAPGFATQARTNIIVTVGASLAVNVVMQAGDQKQVIREALSGNSENQASPAVTGNVSPRSATRP